MSSLKLNVSEAYFSSDWIYRKEHLELGVTNDGFLLNNILIKRKEGTSKCILGGAIKQSLGAPWRAMYFNHRYKGKTTETLGLYFPSLRGRRLKGKGKGVLVVLRPNSPPLRPNSPPI